MEDNLNLESKDSSKYLQTIETNENSHKVNKTLKNNSNNNAQKLGREKVQGLCKIHLSLRDND